MFSTDIYTMRMKNIVIMLLLPMAVSAQTDTLSLTLADAITMARKESSDARAAYHTLLAAEWSYKFYRANYLPTLTLTSSPTLNRVISKITQPDGTSSFVEQNHLSTDVTLGFTQNVSLTGGQFFVETSLQRQYEFADNTTAYNSQPLIVGYRQTLFGYNSLKWERRMEPLRYEQARKSHTENMELIAAQTSTLFFALASAQTELYIAEQNYASADTMSRYARGRYDIGTITENEMLQLELNKFTAEANLLNARNGLENAMLSLRSYLALDKDVTIKAESDLRVPRCKADLSKAISLAHEHNPDPVSYELMRQESKSNLASAQANSGLKADLYMQFGLTQTAGNLCDSYRSPQNRQYASIGISLPILDYGRGKGRIKVAESKVNLVETQIEQAYREFDINIGKMVRQFNLQAHHVEIAEKRARLAQQRYDVARRLYINGKSTILDFNAATTEKDSAKRSLLSALQTFWTLYYGLRSMTGGNIFDDSL